MSNPALIAQGPMFIGFTLNVLLFGIMITQVYIYFTTYKKDPILLKLVVLFLLIADTANTIFDFLYLYNVLILHFGEMALLAKADWLFATDPVVTGMIAATVQYFFAWRVLVLTRSWTLVSLVSTLATAGLVGSILTTYEVGRTPDFVDFRNFKSVVILWLTAESVGDLLITGILVRFLRKHKTGFKNSDMIVDRIIRVTVQTGLVTSVVAILDLIFFLADPTGTHLIFNFPLCKLYTNSMMSSLNSRKGWRFASTTQTSNSRGLTEESFRVNSCPMGVEVDTLTTTNSMADGDVPLSPTTKKNPVPSRIREKDASFEFSPTNRPEIFVSVESHQQLDAVISPRTPSSRKNNRRSRQEADGMAIHQPGSRHLDSAWNGSGSPRSEDDHESLSPLNGVRMEDIGMRV